MRVLKNRGEACRAHMYLVGIRIDITESQKILEFGSHDAFYGCKYCITLGKNPDQLDKNEISYHLRNHPIRTITSLLFEDETVGFQYDIKSTFIFADLPNFKFIFFLALDKFYLGSRIAKLLHGMLYLELNDKYKHANKKQKYPFQLPASAGDKICQSSQWPKRHISRNLLFCLLVGCTSVRFPHILTPHLSPFAAAAMNNVVCGIKLMLQRHLGSDDICEMENKIDISRSSSLTLMIVSAIRQSP
ncbi:hypothetical protein A0J61_07796 [Choanephora cucurbitarum]|uniref:Uncharacterized protein n=1 Tax=Choanephora cucurbitarum TaxID=101091 RepID=A0A1C7N9Y1_9FUNG|nr:hypothetical protein A0J61_07796 [Choanephora cucurbitarum]